MSTRKKNKKTAILDQEAIDRLVIGQADDNSAWGTPIGSSGPNRRPCPFPAN